jgi:hypothetical protein
VTEQEIKKLIKECEEKGLSAWQIVEVRLGNHMGLSREEILSYAKPENSIEEMERVRMQLQFPELQNDTSQINDADSDKAPVGLEIKGFDYDRLEEIVNLASAQMAETVMTFLKEISNQGKEIRKLQDENRILKQQMEQRMDIGRDIQDMDTGKTSVWKKLKHGKQKHIQSKSIIELLAESGEQYTDAQINELSLAYENGLSMQTIIKFSDPSLSADKMKQLRLIAEHLEGIQTSDQNNIHEDSKDEIENVEEFSDTDLELKEMESEYYVPEDDGGFSIDNET